MAIETELRPDPAAGPGHGILSVPGFTMSGAVLRFQLECNREGARFLGHEGNWQKDAAWLEAAGVSESDSGITARVGPGVVDALIGQPHSVMYRVSIEAGDGVQVRSLTILTGLVGSVAAADTSSSPAESVEDSEHRVVEETDERDTVMVDPLPPPPPVDSKSRVPLLAAAAVLVLLIGVGATAWQMCWFGLRPDQCLPSVASGPANAGAADFSCTGLDADGCYGVGMSAVEAGRVEKARQLFQQASTLGSMDGSLAVARMYDPETWSAEASPVTAADWETAVVWYEKAALGGSVAGQVSAGRLMCRHAKSSMERNQARTFLRQAKEAGSADAEALLRECESNPS